INRDVYHNNKILSPAFSYLSVFVEKNLSRQYYRYLNQLDVITNVNSLIVNNYAFLNKMGYYEGNIYSPYDGQIDAYLLTQNCIFLKFVNNYYIPGTYIERSFRELLY